MHSGACVPECLFDFDYEKYATCVPLLRAHKLLRRFKACC